MLTRYVEARFAKAWPRTALLSGAQREAARFAKAWRRTALSAAALLAAALLVAQFVPQAVSVAGAQSPASGAISLFLDPSVRASGMGRASAGVFWGDDPDAWANPAVLGYHHGIRYEWSRTQLVPDLADDVYFTSKQLTLGAWGVGVRLAGKPIDDLGGLRLDYGESQITNPGDPTVIGTFRSYEEISAFGVGVSAAALADAIGEAVGGHDLRISRFADASWGWTTKSVVVDLAPDIGPGAAKGEADTEDQGLLLRLTPWNSIGGSSLLPGVDRALHPVLGGIRLDAAYGESELNRDGGEISLIDEANPDPISKQLRRGWSMRAAVGLPGALTDQVGGSTARWLIPALTPLLSFGAAWDRVQDETRDPASGEVDTDRTIAYEGWELTIANIYTIRRGTVNDPDGQIFGDTDGWGLGFRLGDVAAFRYDKATVPQYEELDRVTRESWTVTVDPIALVHLLNGRTADNEQY